MSSAAADLLKDLAKHQSTRAMTKNDYDAKFKQYFSSGNFKFTPELADEVLKIGGIWALPVLRWLHETHKILPTMKVPDERKKEMGTWIFDSVDYNGDSSFYDILTQRNKSGAKQMSLSASTASAGNT